MTQAANPQVALPAAKVVAVEHLLLAAISFSDVTFNLFPGESSPLPLMLAAWLLVIRGGIRLSGAILLGVAVFVGLAYSALFQISYSVSVTSTLAYLQLLAVGAYYYKYGWSHGSDFPRLLVFCHLFVGAFQYFGVATNILEAILTSALPRASATALQDIGRGVPFVTTEPSHALQSIALPCYLLLLEKSRDRWFSIVSLALTLLMAGAGVGYLYFIFFIGFFVYRRPVVAGVSVLFVYVMLAYIIPDTRAGGILQVAAPLMSSATVEDLRSVTALSGFRLPSVISSYLSLLSPPISFGFGSWEGSILTLMESAGYDTEMLGHWRFTGEYHPVKPYSPVANLCVDFWWGGLIIVMVMIYSPVKRWFSFESKGAINPAISAFYVACLLGFLFLVTVGKPAFIAVVCMRIPQLVRENVGSISDAR